MKWYYKVFIAVVLLIVVVILGIDTMASRYVDSNMRKLQKQVEGKYNFDYKSLSVSILNKKVVLKDFVFESIVDSVNSENKLYLTINKLKLSFKTYKEVLVEGRLHIIKAQLVRPVIVYGMKKELSKEGLDESSIAPEPDEEVIIEKNDKNFVNTIIFDQIVVKNGIADIYHLEESEKKLLHVDDVDINISDMTLYLGAKGVDQMIDVEDLNIDLSNVTTNELKNHTLDIDNINFTLSKRELNFEGIKFKNIDKPKVHAKKHKYRSPWFDINFERITINLNPWHIYNKGVLYFKKIELDNGYVEIYNDITLELTSVKKPLPPGDIRRIPYPLLIDSIVVKNSELKYLHKDKNDIPGMFGLNALDVKASNITNIDYLVDKNPKMSLVVNSKIWDSGILYANFDINLANYKDIVKVKGSVKNMPLKKAENMLKPLYGVDIFSGQLNLLYYDLTMNDDIGKGILKFDYKDLKVDIKKVNKEESAGMYNESKSNKFLNFLANEAILTNNQKGGNKKYIENGVMIFDRTKNKPIFDLYWKAIQTGIMDIIVADAFYQSEVSYQKKIQKQEKQANKEVKQEQKNAKQEETGKKNKKKKKQKN